MDSIEEAGLSTANASMEDVSISTEPSPTSLSQEAIPETSILDYTPIFNPDPRKLEVDLRVQRSNRLTKLLVVVTVYSEPGHMLTSTLQAIAANVANLERKNWSWENVLVLIVVDGLEKASSSLLKVAEEKMGLMHSSAINGQAFRNKTVVHLFEATRDVDISGDILPTRAHRKHRMKTANGAKTKQRVQFALCLKARNGGKLNSHMWGMLGVARLLNPKYVMTIDVGTVPVPSNFMALMTRMEDCPDIGGAAGEIVPAMYNRCNGTAAAQDFEYWSSSFLDKATEAFFGYISVLPGALSVYRWSAMSGPPLSAYFKLEAMRAADISPFYANLYLAEDRILAFSILAKKDKAWYLDFVPEALAYTDVPEELDALVKQRRRWTNGALFNLIYYLMNVDLHFLSAHTLGRKLLFFLLAMFNMGFALLSYIAVGLLFITYLIIFNAWFSEMGSAGETYSFLLSGYIAAQIFLIFLVGTIGNVTEQKQILVLISHSLSILNVAGLVIGTWVFLRSGLSLLIIAGVFGFFLAFIVVGAVWCNPSRLITAFPFYILKVPSFVSIFTIFSVTNIHDSSWGTKEGQLSQEKYRSLQNEASSIQNKADKLLSAVFALLEFAADSQAHQSPTSGDSESGESAALGQAIHAAAALLAKSLQELHNAPSKTARSSFASVGQVVEHRAAASAPGREEKATSEEHARVLQILERMTNLCEADKVVIMESLDVYQAHQVAAKAAEAAAAVYAIDQAKIKARFSAFRFKYVCVWVFFNMVLVAMVDSFNLEASAAGALAVAVLASSGFRILGSVLFRLQTLSAHYWRRHCRSKLCSKCIRTDERTSKETCSCCASEDLREREHAWLDDHGLSVDPNPLFTGPGIAPTKTQSKNALDSIQIKIEQGQRHKSFEQNPPAHDERSIVSEAQVSSTRHTSETASDFVSNLRTPKASQNGRSNGDNTQQLDQTEGSGPSILPSPPRINTGTHEQGNSMALPPTNNGMFMFWTDPAYGSDNEYDSDASAISDLDEEVLGTPAAAVAERVRSSPSPVVRSQLPLTQPSEPRSQVREGDTNLLAVHGRDPSRWVPAVRHGPVVRKPWLSAAVNQARTTLTRTQGRSHRAEPAQTQQLFLRDFSRDSFVRHRQVQMQELFTDSGVSGSESRPTARQARRTQTPAQVRQPSNIRRVVAIPSPTRGVAASSPSSITSNMFNANNSPEDTTLESVQHTDSAVSGRRRVSFFRLPSINEATDEPDISVPHGRRQSFLNRPTADGPLGATAMSFMRAIDSQGSSNPTAHSSWNDTEHIQSPMVATPGASASPEQVADSARRTLLRYSAADYSDRVTRAAFKKAHGRRMSTLRNMQRRISTNLPPVMDSDEPSQEPEEIAAVVAPANEQRIAAVPTKKGFPGARRQPKSAEVSTESRPPTAAEPDVPAAACKGRPAAQPIKQAFSDQMKRPKDENK